MLEGCPAFHPTDLRLRENSLLSFFLSFFLRLARLRGGSGAVFRCIMGTLEIAWLTSLSGFLSPFSRALEALIAPQRWSVNSQLSKPEKPKWETRTKDFNHQTQNSRNAIASTCYCVCVLSTMYSMAFTAGYFRGGSNCRVTDRELYMSNGATTGFFFFFSFFFYLSWELSNPDTDCP